MVALALLGGCGGDDRAAPRAGAVSTSVAPSSSTGVTATTSSLPAPTTQPSVTMIIERRPPTDDERLRLGSDNPLDCAHAGWMGWDYDDSRLEDDPGGLTSEEALLDVLHELNDEGAIADENPELVPLTDWLELVEGDTTSFVHIGEGWDIVVTFATHEPAGVFRKLSASVCAPAPPPAPPTAPTSTVSLPPYVETTVILPPGVTLPLPGGYQTAGPVVSALPCDANSRPCVRMEALLTGVLELDGDCLYVDGGDGLLVTVVWSEQTSWNHEHGMLLTEDGTLVGIGEEVSTAGGFVDAARLEEALGIELPPILTDCAARLGTEYWFAGAG